MRAVIAVLLIVEGAGSALSVASLVYTIAAYDPIAVTLIGLRGVVASAALMSGWLLLQRRPPGAALARGTLLASAILFTLEAGFRLAPSGVWPFWRLEALTMYWVYVLGANWWLGKSEET